MIITYPRNPRNFFRDVLLQLHGHFKGCCLWSREICLSTEFFLCPHLLSHSDTGLGLKKTCVISPGMSRVTVNLQLCPTKTRLASNSIFCQTADHVLIPDSSRIQVFAALV